MSTDPKPVQPTAKREVIAVAMLKFSDREPIDVPGLSGKSALTGVARDKAIDGAGKRLINHACYVIDYLPDLQHHRVVYYGAGGEGPKVRMIHASQVRTWEPL